MLPGFGSRVLARWSAGWRDVLSSAVAAGASWWIAVHLFGHSQPIFAAVAAIVCLAPGLPNHGLQAVNMMVGLLLGLLTGEALLLLPMLDGALRIGVIVAAAMLAALAVGIAPVIPIQAGVSAIIVLAMGPQIGGEMRLIDAAIGSGIGVLFSQVLFTPDPVGMIDRAAARMLRLLGDGFDQLAGAVAARDEHRSSGALAHMFASRESLNALWAGIDLARSTARWSLRGRVAAPRVVERGARYDRPAIQLFP